MIDPKHGRRIPSGRRFARALARVFRSLWEQSRATIEAGAVPDSMRMREAVYRLALNAMGVELAAGYVQTMKRQRVPLAVGGRLKALGDVPRLPPPILPTVATATPPPGLVFDWTLFRPEVRVEAERLALRLAGTITEDTRRMVREELSAGLQAGEPVAAMAERVRQAAFSPRRAATIAQTESSRAVHAGQGIAARELGVTDWTWLASSDACDICLALDGKTVKIGEPFYVHATGSPAYRVVYHAPAHPHCYCTNTEEMPE